MTSSAALLALILTLAPGASIPASVGIARTALVRAGCADVRIVVSPTPGRVEIRATCARLGLPSASTVEDQAARAWCPGWGSVP